MCEYCEHETNEEAKRFPLFYDNGKVMDMPVIDIKPLPNANGNIKQGLKNLYASMPKDTVILCPYISYIFTR